MCAQINHDRIHSFASERTYSLWRCPVTNSPPIAEVFPPFQRRALVAAAASGDWREIDRITDTLVLMGLCRPRGEQRIGRSTGNRPDADKCPRVPNEFE